MAPCDDGMVPLVFSLAAAETRLGETLHVVGDGAALGEWDPDRAVPLATTAAAYPRWSSQIVWIPCPEGDNAVKVSYKFIRNQCALGGSMKWEDSIANRTVALPLAEPASRTDHDIAQGPAVWVTGDLAWDRADVAAPHVLDAPKSKSPSKAPPEVAVRHRPPEIGVEDRFEACQGRKMSPERGGDSGDVIFSAEDVLRLESTFTPSTRCASPSPMCSSTRTFTSSHPVGSPAALKKHTSASLFPDLDEKPIQDAKEEWSAKEYSPKMVREGSVSSLAGIVSPRGLQSVGVLCGVTSPTGMERKPSISLLPECMERKPSVSLLADYLDEGERGPDAVGDEHPSQTLAASGGASIPSTFEDAYTVTSEHPIGEGTFGLVWNCQRKTGDQALLAVKRISKTRLQPVDVRNLFGSDDMEGEIRMHLRLKHEHIVAMHEVFNDVGITSLVMECCRGGDLFDLITSHAAAQGKGLPERTSARVLGHLLLALDYCHSIHIVHRDVKCENVLLLQRGVPLDQGTYKLCDFGFAAVQTSSGSGRHLKSRLGSPDAVAPEVVRGEEYSTPVDLWAAGVLLFMSLSATPPFFAKTDIQVLQRVRAGNYSFVHQRWRAVSPEAKGLVRRLLAFYPADRVTAPEALELEWVARPHPLPH